MTEEERYATIQAQMEEIRDRAATYNNPVIGILSAMLHAEMYARNERHHQRALEARREFVATLEARLRGLPNSWLFYNHQIDNAS